MPRYEFRCPDGHTQCVACSYDNRPQALACQSCGKTAVPVISGGAAVFAKNRPWQYDKRWCIPNMGRHARSDTAQGRVYDQIVGQAKKVAKQSRRDLGKKDDLLFEHIGRVPLEVHEAVVEQTQDKNIWSSDTERLLKKTNCWLGE